MPPACADFGSFPIARSEFREPRWGSQVRRDADTNLTTTYGYDDQGNRLSATAPDPSATGATGAGRVVTRYAYDAQGRLCRVLERGDGRPSGARRFAPYTGGVPSRVILGLVAVALALGAPWGASTVLENQRRDEAVQRLLDRVDQAPDGSDIDLATAFDLDWDRAVLVGSYWPGSAANEALGFDRYPRDEVITQGDGSYLLVFTRDRSVVAELRLYGQAFYFDESVESFASNSARFHVQSDASGVLLKPLE
jgi:YD repeat-containing protein